MDQDGFSSQFEVFASGTVAEKAELVFVDPDPSDAPAAIRLIDMEVI